MKDGYEFIDVLSFDPDTMAAVCPSIVESKALVLLFPLSSEDNQIVGYDTHFNVYFMKQTIENACGTIALLHILANEPDLTVPNSFLHNFVDNTRGLDPNGRAKSLETNERVRELHAKYSILGQSEAPEPSEVVNLHFVAFVQVNGLLFELDGRKEGPVYHGPICGNFFKTCSSIIQRVFIDKQVNVLFNALALVRNE